MVALQPVLKKAYWTLAICAGGYIAALFALTFPALQRHALYAHKLNPSVFENVSDVERFGFLKHQVQPFSLATPDSETLYAWHILPLHLCYERGATDALRYVPDVATSENVTATEIAQLLTSNPNARVVINFHGNAGHLASAIRPQIYKNILSLSTPSDPIHVFALDYRGFGLSTGSPTESGLLNDALALVNHLTSRTGLNIDPSRILLFGQSLGTAVASAVAAHYLQAHPSPVSFAGIVLAAPFPSLPSLISHYSIKGIVPPVLTPLQAFPAFANYFRSTIEDTWNTSARAASLISTPGKVDLTVVHARDDWEIPWRQGREVWESVLLATKAEGNLVVRRGRAELDEHEVRVWQSDDGEKRVRWERVRWGGHNRVATGGEVTMAILRAFEL